jgi:predicted TIM-barrel fold metal-dependent hydrolase
VSLGLDYSFRNNYDLLISDGDSVSMKQHLAAVLVVLLGGSVLPVLAVEPIGGVPAWQNEATTLKYDRIRLVQGWRSRIQEFLDKGVVPLVDLESSLPERDANMYLSSAMRKMDELGVALIAFDGYQWPRQGKGGEESYRWSDYIVQIANAYPDYFIPTTNGGANKNWTAQKDSYIGQLEQQIKTGQYPIMGELEFRHYLSSSQCREGREDRNITIPLISANGHRLFTLSAQTGVPFVIHLEPEDQPLADLETMLAKYPKSRVIVTHFGQLRFPERERRFTPEFVRGLFTKYPNVYYDLSTGAPGRRYACNNNVLDTVLWEDSLIGQSDRLKSAYKALLTEYSNRFVVGTDYGGGRKPLPDFLPERVDNLRRILSQLPVEAQHNIGYRNAWLLLTSQSWPGGAPGL